VHHLALYHLFCARAIFGATSCCCFMEPRKRFALLPLEHCHKLFDGLKKARIEAFADIQVFCAQSAFMDML
jgi:hypothetical protein